MKWIATPLLVLTVLAIAPPAVALSGTAPPSGDAERLAVSFLTTGFLAEVAARIEANRTEAERLAGGYLQEKTGLIWARHDNGADLDWYAADEYCLDLEVADWDDWRMPTIDELERLHERRSTATHKLPPAIRLTGCCPWSRSQSADGSAWNFSFRYRKRFSGSLNYSYELRALCVRSAAAEDVLFYELAAEEAELEAKGKRKKSRS